MHSSFPTTLRITVSETPRWRFITLCCCGRVVPRDHEKFTVHFSENRKNEFFFINCRGAPRDRQKRALQFLQKKRCCFKQFLNAPARRLGNSDTQSKTYWRLMLLQCNLIHVTKAYNLDNAHEATNATNQKMRMCISAPPRSEVRALSMRKSALMYIRPLSWRVARS